MARRAQLDKYYRRAKQEGFAARSVYKLDEINRRYGILHGGQRVLDLGCHPGSWLQFVSQKIGPKGLVAGVDIQPLEIELPANARFLRADIFELSPEGLRELAPEFDLVLSDAAPRTTGVMHADMAASLELTERTLDLALRVLKPGGGYLAKLFQGPGSDDLIKRVKTSFKMGKAHKPPASRSASKEIYLLGQGKKP